MFNSTLATAAFAFLGSLLTDFQDGWYSHTYDITAEKNKVDTVADFLNETMYTGMIHVGKDGGEMFYALFESRSSKPKDDPLVMWLTGGPGCSSEFAWTFENGPFTMQKNATVKNNPHSWNTNANMLYIDQPLGTGFSETNNPLNYVTNEEMISKDMAQFLTRFLKLYPEYKNRPFFITGESYAGHYIPSIAHWLHVNPVEDLALKGIGIGNGWVSPIDQYPAYVSYAKDNGLIDEAQMEKYKKGMEQCTKYIAEGQWKVALGVCGMIVGSMMGSLNPYDIRLQCEVHPLCYNTTDVVQFFNKKEIQDEMKVSRQWEDCNMLVYAALLGDWMLSEHEKITDLLDTGYRVLVYSGDKDYICNWYGGKAWTDKQNWAGKKEFNDAKVQKWPSSANDGESKAKGEMKAYKNFAFLRVFNAGHMVPMDQPAAASELLHELLTEKSTIFTSGMVADTKAVSTAQDKKVFK